MTPEEIGCLERFGVAIHEGTYCPDPSPFHGELIEKAVRELRAAADRATYTTALQVRASDLEDQVEYWKGLWDGKPSDGADDE
jgi:hypothetical protein